MNDQIRERAFQLWEQEGRPDGRHEAHWLMASEELSARNNGEEQDAGGLSTSLEAGGTSPGGAPEAGSDSAGGARGSKIVRSVSAKRKRA